ncbi:MULTISPECIES: ABC transporter permease [Thermaerobacter]|uniref:Transport permease protein n=1 Tax=Thermaerobacter composti TaxID=554949 RepID=A0ABZ0QNR3_9FIRM|nr:MULTISPECIES: ABC transporter permease [Thermaerobacter]PZN01847.1 MAG: ABC transporter [Bacillota bacterium]QBS36900.1 ABC transporter [Thermaerobacter sp. FW80]WPD18889.1 ABC transporter permease [Thermaerobacter composti]
MGAFWLENRILLLRWWFRLRREPLTLLSTLAQPVLWLLLFGHLLARMAAGEVPGGDYLRFMTAGAMVMTVFNGAVNGGVELLFDRETGFLQRLLAAPIRRLSIVTSRFAYIVAVTAVQNLLITLTAFLMGVRFATGLGGVVAALAIGALFGAGVATLSIALAFAVPRHPEFFTITGFLSLPLLFLSSALAPLELMPGWMQVLARVNPMTYAIEATRVLVLRGWDPAGVTSMLAALLAFDLLALAVAARVLRRGLA